MGSRDKVHSFKQESGRLGTVGAPPPFALNGGARFRGPDGGAAEASRSAAELRARGTAPNYSGQTGPIETRWGTGFRRYPDCLSYIESAGMNERLAEGELIVPLRYIAAEEPTFSHVPSNSVWKKSHDPGVGVAPQMNSFMEESRFEGRKNLFFPTLLRSGRRLSEYRPGLSLDDPESMDRLGINLLNRPSRVKDYFLDYERVANEYYPEIEQLLRDFYPGVEDAYVFDHNVSDRANMKKEDQERHDPGVGGYAELVHNDYTDNSGPGRARELLTQNLRNWHPRAQERLCSEKQADEILSRRFMEVNLWRPVEVVQQNPLALCAWPSFADQPYVTNYRIYDDRVGETQAFTHRESHEWYWFPLQDPDEISILKCYDSETNGEMSRWSFHTAFRDHTAPEDAPDRRNIVVRAYVFFQA